LLQHPRERDMPIGTARMATLCLPNAELHEGVRWGDEALDRVLRVGEGGPPPVLLYPGEGAVDVMQHPPAGPVTLVVVDGTWWQARKLVRESPRLAALPRYAFIPPRPSEYRIRKEPAESCVSTLEALAHVLGVLEGDAARFDALLVPFRAMIDTQIACARELHGARERHAKKGPRPRGRTVHPWLRSPDTEIVCVAGEANAWPYCGRPRTGGDHEDELVHWVACRISTGELFDRVVAPARPLAPRTPSYVELDEPTLRAGGTHEALFESFRGFLRETDVVCFWGHYAAALFVSSGGALPASRLDLRTASRDHAKARVGTLEEHIARTGAHVPPPRVPGRAGRRLAQLSALVGYFRELAGSAA
jgi:DTW domain-containing protein YfiP